MSDWDSGAISAAVAAEDYQSAIDQVRAAMDADRVAAMADPVIRDWIGRRYRNIFIDEAAVNPAALKHSQRFFPLSLVDTRSDREKVARRMFRNIEDAEIHAEMPRATPQFGSTTLLFCPGLITGYMPGLAFQQEFPALVERFGVPILSADSHPVRSCEGNVADLSDSMEKGIGNAPDEQGTLLTEADHPTPPGDVVLMGYSKGAPDISTFLVHRPDLVGRVKAVVSWAGAHGGSPLADDMYKKFSKIPDSDMAINLNRHMAELLRRMAPFASVKRLDRRIDEYDIKGALYSLTTGRREEFNRENAAVLDDYGLPTLYFTGSTSAREVTYYNLQGELELDKYDKLNDMQLTQAEATPATVDAVHCAMWHATHWDMSYDPWPWYDTAGSRELKEPFTRYSAMSAILLMLSELGLME